MFTHVEEFELMTPLREFLRRKGVQEFPYTDSNPEKNSLKKVNI